jgi:hypothetical protein
MTKTAVFPTGTYLVGEVYEVDNKTASALLAYESAVLVDSDTLAEKREMKVVQNYQKR